MSRKSSSLKKEQKPARNSLEIRRTNLSSSIGDDQPRTRDKRPMQRLNCSGTYAINHSRAVTDGELSAGVTAQLKACVREQLELKRPPDIKLFAKRQTGSLYTGFEPLNGKHRPTNIDRSGERRRSAYEEVLEGDRIKRFHTEKVSLNPSEKNIIKKRRLSFGKDLHNELGRSSELKKTINLDEKKRPIRSIDRNQGEHLYNRAVDLLSQNRVKQAIRDFEMLIEDGSAFKSGSYLWLAICHKKLGKLQPALQILNKALIEFPKHYEALVYRAKLLTKTKRYDRAKRDVAAAIALQPEKALAYMAKGDCLRSSGDFREAQRAYDDAIRCEKGDPSMIYLKKIQMLVEQLQFESAGKDVEQLLKLQPYNSEALAFKGIVQKQQELLVEAALTFEQSLKHNNSRKGVSRALYELIKLKMEQRDYYEAYYALSRSNHLDVDVTLLENFRLFNEAAILLMKRKFQQAINVFNQLMVHQQNLDDFLLPLYHQFKAYGYFCLGRHKEAIIEYKCLDFQTKDYISTFNQFLCEGIVEVQRRHYEEGINYFRKSKEVFPNKVEPYIYVAVTYVREANDLLRQQHIHTPEMQQKRQGAVLRAMEEMNSGNLINDSNSNLLYHRAILCYYLRDFKRGLEDINRCIEKAEDNIPKYFFLRGLGYACSRDPGKAISEFSICISLDNTFSQAYVHRAKCLFLMGQTDNAFKDLHSYMELEAKDMSIHKWIGDLLYESKSYSDALKTYVEIEDIHENQDIVLMRVRCRVRIGLLEEARADLNWLAKANKKFTVSNRVDMNALSLLACLLNRQPANKISANVKRLNDALSEEVKGEIFRVIDCMMLIGIAAGYMGKYSDSISSFMLVKQLYLTNAKRNRSDVKSEVSEEFLNLSLTKVNYNIFLMKCCDKPSEVIDFVRVELLPNMSGADKEKLQPLLDAYLANEHRHFEMVWNVDDELTNKLRWLEIPLGTVMLKTKLQFGCYHEICNDLYPYKEAMGMVELLTPVYVEDKPEAPWIRRNDYGVVFTQDLLKNESIKLQTTEPEKEESEHRAFESHRSQEERRDDIRNFRQRIRLDDQVEQKLMRMLQKTPDVK